MAVITLICKQCGGQISLDDSKRFGFCSHCGTKILLQDEINNITYSTQQNITKIIHGREKTEAEEFIRNGDIFLTLGETEKAAGAYKKAVEANPGDWRVWFSLVRFYTKNFTDLGDTAHLEHLAKARAVAAGEQKTELEKLYAPYAVSVKQFEQYRAASKKGAKFDGTVLLEYKGGDAEFDVPYFVTDIRENAFENCVTLKSVKIPDGVTKIGGRAFCGCASLENIEVASGNSVYRSEGNCIIRRGDNVLTAGCKTSVIPDGVTSVGEFAFGGCAGLKSIAIPRGVTSIGKFAFENCAGLTNITIPAGVTSVGGGCLKTV
ncbi:MAG: leucine-rich repeat protein [Clostridiales bacterium]|jgi:DNA-directed RNA polymerase subunit RPC12/RpoP|nr:leucine-rich repeat protein [Clostridiales bacterium]